MQLTNKIAAIVFVSTLLVFYLASSRGVTVTSIQSSGSIAAVFCNWSVSPLEVNLSADPGATGFASFNVISSNETAGGGGCNEGYIFGLFKDGEAAPLLNLSESSFYLRYDVTKTIFITSSIPDDANFGVHHGAVNVTNGTEVVQVNVTLTITDNVGKFSISIEDVNGTPLSNALVLVSNLTTQAVVAAGITDVNGAWQTNWLPLGEYNITASKTDFLQNSTLATVTKITTTDVVLTLSRSNQSHPPLPPPLGWGVGGKRGTQPGGPGGGGTQVIPTNCIIVGRAMIKLESDDNAGSGVMKLKLKQGTSMQQTVKIKNVCSRDVGVQFDVSGLAEFIAFWQNAVVTKPVVTFNLKPGQEQLVNLVFNARPAQQPDVYSREILIKSETQTASLPVIIEVTSKEALFAVIVEIPPAFSEVQPGASVTANFKVYNLDAPGTGEPKIEMFVKNSLDEVLAMKEKTLVPESQTSFIESFDIPQGTPYGTYVVYARLSRGSKTAVSSAVFRVAEAKMLGLGVNAFLALALVAIALAFLLFRRKPKLFYSPLAGNSD